MSWPDCHTYPGPGTNQHARTNQYPETWCDYLCTSADTHADHAGVGYTRSGVQHFSCRSSDYLGRVGILDSLVNSGS